MILYFADRHFNILGQASTSLPSGLIITDDNKIEDTETGVAVFDCYLNFDSTTKLKAQNLAEVGNYLLRSNGDENEFYTIIEAEIDTKKQTVYIYAEDAGMDLLNEVVGEFEAEEAQPIDYYINKWAVNSGFEIGINEAEGFNRKLKFNAKETVTARIAEVAKQFDCEISYSFKIDGLTIAKKYINIFQQRGKDVGVQLRLNKEIDNIITSKSISNLATAIQCEGGVPEGAEYAVTLQGFNYDDGDFYVDGDVLKSRKALDRWDRFFWKVNQSEQEGGHITKFFSCEAVTQATLCDAAIAELKKLSEIEVNYEADIKLLPEGVKIGDRVNIIDDSGELYLSARILKLETSVTDQTRKATLGEYLIKGSGIAQKVKDLAAQFAANSQNAQRALAIATGAKTSAEQAQAQAITALGEVEKAAQSASNAATAANTATQAADEAKTAANNAQVAVTKVEESVKSLETTVTNAQQAMNNAQQAADNATQKAEEAKTAATNAQTNATEAKTAADQAKTAADNAMFHAATAKETAEIALENADDAIKTAEAAKADALQAEKDIKTFEENLETVESTVKADYARKTELTEATASLQSQITRNAAGITSTVSKLQTIDETANDAAEKAEAAQVAADAATLEAEKAQTYANETLATANAAQTAADNAKAEADTAQAAADNAKIVLDTAKADLIAAKRDLATVSARVDDTEEEIAAAQSAVDTAQAAVTIATTEVETAVAIATEAQTTADEALKTAKEAQATADEAAHQATLAQQLADQLNSEATEAQTAADNAASAAESAKLTAEEAQATANSAQETANNAVVTAEAAKAEADTAKANVETAQAEVEKANEEVTQAQAALSQAQADLQAILADATATAEQIEYYEGLVEQAQTKVTEAQTNATIAAKFAAEAQTAADNAWADYEAAKAVADEATLAANNAQQRADEAQAVVDGLEVRITKTETQLKQTNEQISGSVTALEKKLIQVNGELQEQLNTITKYFTFDINGFTVGQVDSPCKVVIDNDDIKIIVNNEAVQAFDAEGNALIPALKVTKSVNILGYIISEDENGNVNCEYETTGGAE